MLALDEDGAGLLHQGASQAGAGAIGADDRPAAQAARVAAAQVLDVQNLLLEIDVRARVFEMQSHARVLFGGVEQQVIEARTRYRIDHFVFALTVALQREITLQRMQHATAHRGEQAAHGRCQAGTLEGA